MTIAAAAAWRLRLRLFAGPRLLLWLWLLAAWTVPTCIDLVRYTYLSKDARYALGALPAAYLLTALGIHALATRFVSGHSLRLFLPGRDRLPESTRKRHERANRSEKLRSLSAQRQLRLISCWFIQSLQAC